jgi:hypothetical protein
MRTTMTFGEAVTEVRDRVNEASSEDLWSDEAIIRYLDQGLRALCRTRGVEETWLQYLDETDQMNYPADIKQLLRAYYVTTTVDSGTATSGTTISLTDTGKTWTVNEYIGDYLVITAGTGNGQIRRITSNTATALTVATGTAPDTTSTYTIYQGRFSESPLIFAGRDFSVHDGLMTFEDEMDGVIVLLGTRLPEVWTADEDPMDLTEEYVVGAVEYATAMCYYKDENVVLAQQHMALFAEIRQRWEYNPSIQPITIMDTWSGNGSGYRPRHELDEYDGWTRP